ncbi:hypothetical protein JOQ06_009555 [Pogonophryne albipinna]|uniref:Telomeric repeat-binding factor n=1 Tax=Pogonophryne albipinna TaxID=1090488 RepID=A0AAD6FVZ2_9TELE|nr:hypothetical protein JOQ06_009555 [Pogonophryne albipinna]
MAANSQANMEAFVNHWIVDYYSVLAIELFKTKKYEDFCGIVAILDSILTRPVYSSDVTPTKIRVLHFLARINEGENLDVVFEQDPSVSPLESALKVLESMAKDCSTPLPERDFYHASASLKEMMVSLFIKNDEFDKAKEVFNKHFPKPRVGKKAIFTRLINQKSKTHEVIEHIDFQSFREEMFDYCQSLFSDVPFLLRAATRIIEEKRLRDQVAKAAGPDEQEAAGPSSAPQICSVHFTPGKHTILQRTRLEAAFKALSTCSDDKTFVQLEEEEEEEHQARNDFSLRLSPSPEQETNQDPEQDVIFQGDSGSPMEASPTDQTDVVPKAQAEWLSKTSSVPRNKRLWTVARLVVEPDSQGSTPASLEVEETEVRTEEPPQPPAAPDKSAELSVVTVDEDSLPVRKLRRRERNICSRKSEPLSSDSNEEPQESPAPCKAPKSSTPNKDSAREKGPAHSKWKVLYTNAKERSKNQSVNQTLPGHRKMKWNEEETQMLIDGVKRFGEGNWSKIKSHFSFKERSNVSLKDRWRTIKNSKMV